MLLIINRVCMSLVSSSLISLEKILFKANLVSLSSNRGHLKEDKPIETQRKANFQTLKTYSSKRSATTFPKTYFL